MEIKNIAKAGSLESNDVLIYVMPSETREIEIESSVKLQFEAQIRTIVETVLNAYQLEKIKVKIEDKGALDFAIEARLKTAIERAGGMNERA